MYNENLGQPEDLSAEEWAILQHLAQLSASFYMADAALGFNDTSTIEQVSNSLKFAKHFERLKTAGYLAIQPMAFADVKELTRPVYTLSVLGRKATRQ
jgi:hypothetical protein